MAKKISSRIRTCMATGGMIIYFAGFCGTIGKLVYDSYKNSKHQIHSNPVVVQYKDYQNTLRDLKKQKSYLEGFSYESNQIMALLGENKNNLERAINIIENNIKETQNKEEIKEYRAFEQRELDKGISTGFIGFPITLGGLGIAILSAVRFRKNPTQKGKGGS